MTKKIDLEGRIFAMRKMNHDLRVELNFYHKNHINSWLRDFWAGGSREINKERTFILLETINILPVRRFDAIEKLVKNLLLPLKANFLDNIFEIVLREDGNFHWRIEKCADALAQLSNLQKITKSRQEKTPVCRRYRDSDRQEDWIDYDLPDIDVDRYTSYSIFDYSMQDQLWAKVNRELENQLRYLWNFYVDFLLAAFWDSIYLTILKEGDPIVRKIKNEGGDRSDLSFAIAKEAEDLIYLEMKDFLKKQQEIALQLDDDYRPKLNECVNIVRSIMNYPYFEI